MLDAVTLERPGAAIIHVHWKGHGDRSLGVHQAISVVLIDIQVLSDHLELSTGHSKNVVVVNMHRKRAELLDPRDRVRALFGRGSGKSSN